MTEQEIIEGNRRIAEFMGKYIAAGRVYNDEQEFKNMPQDFIRELKYHTSWDWLIPVLEKIKDSSPDHEICIDMGKTFCRVHARNLDDGRYLYGVDSTEDTPIAAIYAAVLQFIKWYQTQTPTK